MKALLIILAVIAFFVLLLSIKFSVIVHMDGEIALSVKWAFIKINILPKKEKKKKKKKKKKKEKKKKDEKPEKKDETVKEPKKKDNIFKRFYRNKGVEGFKELLANLVKDLKKMNRRLVRAFIIDDLFISMFVGAGDSAETAVKFGKTCSAVYPALGFICDTMRVKKQKCEIIPDFINGSNEVRFHVQLSAVPRRLINAFVIVGVQLAFNVLLKFLRGSRSKKARSAEEK